MNWLLVILLVLFVVAAVDRRLAARLAVPETSDEIHRVRTGDGVHVQLHRFRPRAEHAHGEPVILVHGLGANHRNLALDDTYGVAQVLAGQGYDCWALDLRGCGASDVPREPWNFDHHARLDVPAALDHILARTGFDRLHWIGHSMGGMLFYAVAGAGGQGPRIASAVTLGSPVRFFRSRGFEALALRQRNRLSHLVRRLDGRPLLRWAIPLLVFVPRRLLELQINIEQADRRVLRSASTTAVSPVGVRLLLHFADWIVNRRWTSEDQRTDYRASIAEITTPTLVVAGSLDRLCPPWMVKLAFDLLPGGDNQFLEAGPVSGLRAGYSHIDLVFGRNAPAEIFPRIVGWLGNHSARNSAAA
jgi:pimeloyl-ACP methyl ester carboxylesterase